MTDEIEEEIEEPYVSVIPPETDQERAERQRAERRAALIDAGVAPREIRALDHPALVALPKASGGFGLYGPTGSGKTWAMVQTADTLMETYWWWHRSFLWLNWPEQANLIRRAPLNVGKLIAAAKDKMVLFLDDLGAETCKTADDYAFGILKEIVDFRYRHEKQIYWTSNQDAAALNEHYGAGFTSRLIGAWPEYAYKGPDRRIASV